MGETIRKILSSMKGTFLPYHGDSSLIPGGRVRIDDLSYYGVYSDKRHMREDVARVSDDFKKATNEAKSKFQTSKR